jgi:hypothetical protein
MSWEQGYDAGNNGLIAAVNTAKMLGAIEERKRIIQLILTIKDNWEKPAGLNYQAELYKLVLLIEETK